ncbi:Licheninase [Pseudopedobacter saltans DSM 12145]|uniref:Licheninase n=1 Tax=Pseudopedobacter saltans (strain ATCC 51119 / DSM 12145 / JCM 21818 / CCUG 39354 / LMG 10337 / NBRC 100064 / NCIMB 13643) TaxID=762903 RepID=F0SAQ1_PSESL|nr:glycoside hydrolase family 16 protein [Pseudopedobacter saltans]ADY53672.1 Licheninase [Pseudopedobacter saltans DSM 12145]
MKPQKNIKAPKISLLTLFVCVLSLSGKTNAEDNKQVKNKDWQFETQPFWSDEFDYSGKPDERKWGYDLGSGNNGWGNQELQHYTQDIKNVRVENGVLKISALKEDIEGKKYSSARLVSKGKGDFLYGRFEFRAKLPEGRGTWPALWMLPTDWVYGGWPKSGEIDIMEHVGYDKNNVHVTVHTEAHNGMKGTQKGKAKIIDGATADFHLYRVDWTPYAIKGYIDDEKVFEYINEGKGFESWPFDKRFHILMNVAIGGSWGGQKGVDDTVFPAVMEIDYVRVYRMIEQKK